MLSEIEFLFGVCWGGGLKGWEGVQFRESEV